MKLLLNKIDEDDFVYKEDHSLIRWVFCSWEQLLRTLWVLWQPTLLHYNLRVLSRNRGWSIILCFVFSSFILFSILSRLVSLEDMIYEKKLYDGCILLPYFLLFFVVLHCFHPQRRHHCLLHTQKRGGVRLSLRTQENLRISTWRLWLELWVPWRKHWLWFQCR